MATLKLKPRTDRAPASSADRGPKRPPVRGHGSGVRARPTLAEADAERERRRARAAAEDRGGRPDGERGPQARGHDRGADDRRGAPHPGRGGPSVQGGRHGDAPRRDDRGPARRDERGPMRRDDRGPMRRDERAGPRFDDRHPPRRDDRAPPRRDDRSPPRRDDRPAAARLDRRPSPTWEPPRDDRPRDPAARSGFEGRAADPRGRDPRSRDPRDLDPRRDPRRDGPPARPPAGRNTAFGPGPSQGPQGSHGTPRGPATSAARPSRARPGSGAFGKPVFEHHHARDADDDTEHVDAAGSLRLSKYMAELGLASRREADEWIARGWVRVDGRVFAELGTRVQRGQQVTIDAQARDQQSQKVTVLINKPVGYVSGQAEDGYEPAYVLVKPPHQWREDQSGIRYKPMHLRSLVPAGRLDIDSTGLLVLTQDGRIARQLIGEDTSVEKEYLVRVVPVDGGGWDEAAGLARLRHGLSLDDEPLKPAEVERVNDDQLRFVLREGKKRQIRRMCEAVGLEVVGLKRVRIGRVMLGDLPPGQWRYLRRDEAF